MKKRFLPFSLLLVIMILGQSVMADQGGHYVPRVKGTATAEAYVSSMRVNQHTGLIDPAWMLAAARQMDNRVDPTEDPLYWRSMGPDNFGGRTTSIVYNVLNRNEVYIGSMGGGVYRTWNLGVSWHRVGENLMVSSLAQDASGVIYVGTGDGGAAVSFNGLSDYGYEHSFIGSGLYKIDVANGNTMTLIPSTDPQNNAGWNFINDVAVDNNMVLVATEGGLRYSNDGGNTWNFAVIAGGNGNLTGNAVGVKVAPDHTIVAAVDGVLYIGAVDAMTCYSSDGGTEVNGVITMIPQADDMLDIAVSPNNSNVIYAACIKINANDLGQHKCIYVTEDKGASWRVVLPEVDNNQGHQVYEGRGQFNHGLVVDPQNDGCVYVMGYNLWRLRRSEVDPEGYYLAVKLSDGNNTSLYSNLYLHVGLNAMAFDPRDPKKAYIATDGGIFQGQFPGGSDYMTFVNCNRGYSTTRCLAVAPSNTATRLVASMLDYGPVLVECNEENPDLHQNAGYTLFPTNTASDYGMFDDSYNSASCAVSSIDPEIFILVTDDGAIQRTSTAGADYVSTNFLENLNSDAEFTFTGLGMPIVLWESFNDEYNLDEVMFKCTKDLYAGETVQCFSNNGDYPFDYVLEHDMHYDTVNPALSDSIFVHDPVASKFYVADDNGIHFTRDALKFNIAPVWYDLLTSNNGLEGVPSCLAISNDGEVVYMGTREGGLYRLTNMNACVDDSTSTIGASQFAPVITVIDLGVDQCVTSVSISNDNNKVLVTLGNYGNTNYVYYSNNALAADPTFAPKMGGELTAMPVYSSVIDLTTGHAIIGTEQGIFRCENLDGGANWVAEKGGMGNVPVMDLKQQTIYQPRPWVPVYVNDTIVMMPFHGVNNQGTIYAATYGRGVFRCENYLQHVNWDPQSDVAESPVEASALTMYPNPVRDQAKVSFELNSNAPVSYQVFDITGRMVRSEAVGSFVEGKHEINLNVEGLTSGAYVLRFVAGQKTETVKFMVF